MYQGPFGCTSTLPKALPPVYTVERKYLRSGPHSISRAGQTGLLNDRLLLLMSVVEPKMSESCPSTAPSDRDHLPPTRKLV